MYQKILTALNKLGKTNITRQDLAAVDEFHVRCALVSMELAREADLHKGMRILDAGCGIGGPARMLANEYGCHVTGIDITKEFIETAKLLTRLVGLEEFAELTGEIFMVKVQPVIVFQFAIKDFLVINDIKFNFRVFQYQGNGIIPRLLVGR